MKKLLMSLVLFAAAMSAQTFEAGNGVTLHELEPIEFHTEAASGKQHFAGDPGSSSGDAMYVGATIGEFIKATEDHQVGVYIDLPKIGGNLPNGKCGSICTTNAGTQDWTKMFESSTIWTFHFDYQDIGITGDQLKVAVKSIAEANRITSCTAQLKALTKGKEYIQVSMDGSSMVIHGKTYLSGDGICWHEAPAIGRKE